MRISKDNSGQMMLEYGIMFVVILIVIVYAATTFVKPRMCTFYNNAAGIIDIATNQCNNFGVKITF